MMPCQRGSLYMNRASDGKERQRRFDELCTALRPDLFRFAFWLSRDCVIAEDVVQETLLRAWRAMDELRDVKAARQWLLTIVRREHARLYERKRLQTVDVDDLVAREELLLAAPDDIEVQDLRRALLQLEESYREPLVLQVLMGYSTEEIAQHMGLNVGAVLTRLFRARQQLRADPDGWRSARAAFCAAGRHMNCLDYQHNLQTEPHRPTTEMRAHAQSCAACAAWTQQMHAFDAGIKRALQINVPPAREPSLAAQRHDCAAALRVGSKRSGRNRFGDAGMVLVPARYAGSGSHRACGA